MNDVLDYLKSFIEQNASIKAEGRVREQVLEELAMDLYIELARICDVDRVTKG